MRKGLRLPGAGFRYGGRSEIVGVPGRPLPGRLRWGAARLGYEDAARPVGRSEARPVGRSEGRAMNAADRLATQVPNVYARVLQHPHDTPRSADPSLIDDLLATVPSAPLIASHNRSFVLAAVRECVRRHGVTQVLDIGAGHPMETNVHDVVRAQAPDARVVYVDHSAEVVARLAECTSAVEPGAIGCLVADARDAHHILTSPVVTDTLDLDRPVTLVMAAVLPYLAEVDLSALLAQYTAALVPGSMLVLSHGTHDFAPDKVRQLQEVYARHGVPSRMRTRDELAQLMDQAGVELLAPGIVATNQWHPDGARAADAAEACLYGWWGRVR